MPRSPWPHAAALVVVAAALASVAPAPRAAETLHRDDYLHDLASVEDSAAAAEEALKSPDAATRDQALRTLNGVLQGLAELRANVGDERGALEAFGRLWRHRERAGRVAVVGNASADLRAIDGAHAEDAVAAIARAARSRQVVILNEAHHVPSDRMLAMRLARALRRQGFDYLACETFTRAGAQALASAYVAQNTGTYSREPTFAKFLTDAQSDGWKFVAYEPDTEPRESGMAKNLINRIFATHPDARVFIYAGYSHAMKLPESRRDDDESKLAAQLHRLTGIDPLTINQTTLFAQYESAQQARCYTHALRKLKGRVPAVLIGADGNPVRLGIDRFAYDFEIVHPRYTDDPAARRAEWLDSGFEPRDIPAGLVPRAGLRAIYAYRRGSPPDAVPLDVVVLRAGAAPAKLMLPAGDFEIEYED